MGELYSHSRLSSFENCPKKFEYRYVLKVPAPTESIEAFVGKRVHEILERLYLAVGRGQVPGLDQVLHRYHAIWDEHFDAERVRTVRRGVPVSTYRDQGVRALTSFYRRTYPFDQDETLALEARFTFALDAQGAYRMQGIVDRVARAADGVIEIHDYKTSRRVPKQSDLDADRQLALYQIGATQRYGDDQPMRLVWHYVTRDQRRCSTRTPEQLGALGEETMALIDRIRVEKSFEPRKSALCDWCEYGDRCPIGPRRGDAAPAPAPSPAPVQAPSQPAQGQLSLL